MISVLFLLCFLALLFMDALWLPAGKGLASRLSFVMSNCEGVHFPINILGQVWCLIVSIPDLCPLSYFVICQQQICRLKSVLLCSLISAFIISCLEIVIDTLS